MIDYLSFTTMPVILLAGLVLYQLLAFTYRLLFSPLAKFPGQKIAGMTHW